MKKQVLELSDEIYQNRTDVSEILAGIGNGQDWKAEGLELEHRFIYATLPEPATHIMYDTMTTLVHYSVDGEEYTCDDVDHDYKD